VRSESSAGNKRGCQKRRIPGGRTSGKGKSQNNPIKTKAIHRIHKKLNGRSSKCNGGGSTWEKLGGELLTQHTKKNIAAPEKVPECAKKFGNREKKNQEGQIRKEKKKGDFEDQSK